jgi:hypothetical protein
MEKASAEAEVKKAKQQLTQQAARAPWVQFQDVDHHRCEGSDSTKQQGGRQLHVCQLQVVQ